MNYIQAGRLIRSLRKEKDISMVDFAQRLDVSQASISRIESGIQEVNFTMLSKICEQFDITLSTFFLLLEKKVDTNIEITIEDSSFSQTENLTEELFKIINNLTEDQKKGLYILLLPYI